VPTSRLGVLGSEQSESIDFFYQNERIELRSERWPKDRLKWASATILNNNKMRPDVHPRRSKFQRSLLSNSEN
jgi:hypothetical protein